jgi:type II secretion system protein N
VKSAILKSALRYTGYALFFVVALLLFTWWTLPLDAVKDLIVRKAADEHNLNVSIGDLSTWGLSGIEASDVTVTPRPTAEEQAAYEQAKKVRDDWDAKRKAEKAAGGAAPSAPASVAAAPGSAGDDEAAPPGGAAPGSVADDKPPPMPEGPQPLHIDELKVKVGLFSLLGGGLKGHLEAKLLGGEMQGDVDRNHEALKVAARWSELDLRQLEVLRRLLPLPIAGGFQGDVDVEVPAGDQGALKLASMTGHVNLKVANGTIGPGRIESDKLGAFSYFDVPKARLDELGGKITLDKRRGTFEGFKVAGKDLDGEITGYIQLADKFDRWAPRAHLRFKFSDEFLDKNKDVKVAMNSIGYLKRGQLDGYTGFSVTGTFQHPQFQPRKRSPYTSDAGHGQHGPDDEDASAGSDAVRKPLGSSARLDRDRARLGAGSDDEAGGARAPSPFLPPPPRHDEETGAADMHIRPAPPHVAPTVVPAGIPQDLPAPEPPPAPEPEPLPVAEPEPAPAEPQPTEPADIQPPDQPTTDQPGEAPADNTAGGE